MKRRKICAITTSRADFGLMAGLLKAIKDDSELQLQLIVSGMHLSQAFGMTVREIEAEGFKIDRKINLRLSGSTALSNLKSMAIGMSGFAMALEELQPALVMLLGDRFELMPVALSALMLRIPIAHIHGGELSEGAIDDSVRHAITKLACYHFPATEIYRRRIIQMGETPERVFNHGAPGLDLLYGKQLMTREELEADIGLNFREPVAIVTFHPATLDSMSPETQTGHLMWGIKTSGIKAIFTMANADASGARISAQLKSFCTKNPGRFKWVPHLGHRRYLSCLQHCVAMIGNSSSGITEAPSFGLPVVNVGDRQRGRVRAPNIIDVAGSRAAIAQGIKRALSPTFRNSLRGMRNPYDRYRDGKTSERIKETLKRVKLTSECLAKKFYDMA